jgi:hypothetical protein
MPRTQSRTGVSIGLQGVREAVRRQERVRFNALLHDVTVDLLHESFYALKRQAVPGVDGVTWQEYEDGLDERLIDLHERIHLGTYQAKPSKRAYIPMGFQYREEAERFLRDVAERMGKFGLALPPEKTRLIEFGRFAAERRRKPGLGKPEAFVYSRKCQTLGVPRQSRRFTPLIKVIILLCPPQRILSAIVHAATDARREQSGME